MGLWDSYRMRLRRKRLRLRALRKRHELRSVTDRTAGIRPGDVLVFSTQRNEMARLPWFLDYYRGLGADHFLFVDNDSDDGSLDYLTRQPDASVWSTDASYRASRFGMDWMNALLRRYGHGHWTLTVDPDELLVYPFCDTRPLAGLTDWLDSCGIKAFPAMQLDMYPKGPIGAATYRPGQDPLEVLPWFDAGNYTISRNWGYNNLWIQGGPRARAFFCDQPHRAPALNKIPLVRWHSRYVYVSSTHNLLPRGLNLVFDDMGARNRAACCCIRSSCPRSARRPTKS